MTNKYDEYDWDELPSKVAKAFAALGYNQKIWDNDKKPSTDAKDWDELNAAEQAAAKSLGYNASNWDSE